MKKIISFTIVLFLTFILISCSPAKIKIKFNTNGGTLLEDIVLEEENLEYTFLPTSSKEGYEFEGWYYDKEFLNRLERNKKIKKSFTLYAKYELILNKHENIAMLGFLHLVKNYKNSNLRETYNYDRLSMSFLNVRIIRWYSLSTNYSFWRICLELQAKNNLGNLEIKTYEVFLETDLEYLDYFELEYYDFKAPEEEDIPGISKNGYDLDVSRLNEKLYEYE